MVMARRLMIAFIISRISEKKFAHGVNFTIVRVPAHTFSPQYTTL